MRPHAAPTGRPHRSVRGTMLIAGACLGVLVLVGCKKRTDISGYPEIVERIPKTELQGELVKTIEPKVGELRGIAIDGADRIYVLGSNRLCILDADGSEVRTLQVPADARALAVADDGSVYVARTARILKLDRDGKQLTAWGGKGSRPGELGDVTSIGVAGSNVLVADYRNLCIQRFDTAGRFLNLIGKRDDAKDFVGMLAPSGYMDFVVDQDGKVIVGNSGRLRVETYSMEGELLGAWGKAGYAAEHFAPCCNPTNIALTRDGNVVTAEKGIPRVKVYDRTGKLLAYIPQKGNFSKEARGMDLAVDSKNRIYVAEPVRGVVMVFALKKAHE